VSDRARLHRSINFPNNLIHLRVNGLITKGLVDTGTIDTLMSSIFCDRLKKQNTNRGKFNCKLLSRRMLATNATAIEITCRVETEARTNGLTVPIECEVADGLTYDLILRMDFLRDIAAVIDIYSNTLTSYGGILTVPMMKVGQDLTAFTEASVSFPPQSEALIAVWVNTRP
jgi:hypothetical protein